MAQSMMPNGPVGPRILCGDAMKLIWLLPILGAASCGPSVSGPAEISAGGLTYDVRDGGRFVGLPLTEASAMPTADATYSGRYQLQVGAFLEKGDATLGLDIATGDLALTVRAEFPSEAPIQIYQNTFQATVTGTEFQADTTVFLPEIGVSEVDQYISGRFYGDDGSVIAGNVSDRIDENETVFGTFIVVD